MGEKGLGRKEEPATCENDEAVAEGEGDDQAGATAGGEVVKTTSRRTVRPKLNGTFLKPLLARKTRLVRKGKLVEGVTFAKYVIVEVAEATAGEKQQAMTHNDRGRLVRTLDGELLVRKPPCRMAL